jgi:hypothetical protein
MILAAIFAGPLAHEVLSRFMRPGVLVDGLAWVSAGLTLFSVDLIWRFREKEPEGWARFFSSWAGGCVRVWPIWAIGLTVIVLGALFAMGIT